MIKLSQGKLDAMNDSFTFVPEHTRDTLVKYIESGVPTGSFVQAVLENNLRETFGRADHINSQHIGTICAWLYNFAPSSCWGSPDRVQNWYEAHKAAREAI